MACTPGSPCNPLVVNSVYPKKCNNGWFAGYPINTNLICYNGSELPNSGVAFAEAFCQIANACASYTTTTTTTVAP